MDEDPRENSSDEEVQDETEEKESETSNLVTDHSKIYPKISPESLKRQPLRQRKEPFKKKSEEKCSNFNQTKKAESPSATPNSLGRFIYFFLIFAIVILLGVYFWIKNSSTLEKKQLNVEDVIGDLKSKFGGQPSLTYKVIAGAIKRAARENSDSPGIIFLLSSVKAKKITYELADRLVQLVSDPLDYVLIDSRSSLTAEGLKKEIDVAIRGNLTDKQMRGVLVKNLDEIPFEAAMMFHSYCDHENAPFKKVIYVMTAFVEEIISPSSDPKQWDVLASKRLKAVWNDSGEDQVASLISRLTGSVAAILSE